jgi:hypothetical protein
VISFIKSYQTSDSNVFPTLALAQEHELILLLKPVGLTGANDGEATINRVAKCILENAPQIVDILTTKSNSKPKARAANGGRKPRKNPALQQLKDMISRGPTPKPA